MQSSTEPWKTRILFIDFEPEEMKRLWADTPRSRYNSFLPMFVDITDPELRYCVDFDPFIVVICNDYGEANEALTPFLSSQSKPHVVVVNYHDPFPSPLLVCDEFDSCRRTVESLENIISDIVPF